jgi:hypothetical protein
MTSIIYCCDHAQCFVSELNVPAIASEALAVWLAMASSANGTAYRPILDANSRSPCRCAHVLFAITVS